MCRVRFFFSVYIKKWYYAKYFKDTTLDVVTSNTDTTYNGAYVRVGSKVLDTSNKWGRIFLTLAENDNTDYSAYTAVKAYIYLEAMDSGALSLSFAGHTAQNVTKNQWTEVIIPMDKFIAAATQAAASAEPTAGIFVEMNFNTRYLVAVRIGEITAVK